MADINNALAAQIRVPDSGNPLDTLTKLNQFQLGQQALQHRQFLYDQGGGYDPGELSTLEEVRQKRLENAGRIGNMLYGDQSVASRKQAIQAAKDAGVKIDPNVEQHILTAPAGTVKQYGANMMQAGQPAQAAIEQSGIPAANRAREEGQYLPQGIPANEPIISRTEAATGGRKPVSSSAAIMGDDEAVRKGLYSPTPEQIKRGITGPTSTSGFEQPSGRTTAPQVVRNPDGSISSSVTAETTGKQASLAKDYDQYKDDAKSAATSKYLLHNMRDDAERLSTGKGATFTNTARQWIQSAQTIPGVGDVVKKITGDVSDPIAAFEAIKKNQGQLTRATLKDADGSAAAEYRMVQDSLPSVELSQRGLRLVTAQMMAPYDWRQAKLALADKWKQNHGDSLDGFETSFNKNFSPSTFLFGRLDPQERDSLVKNLSKTTEGQNTLKRIRSQAEWLHQNGYDWVLD